MCSPPFRSAIAMSSPSELSLDYKHNSLSMIQNQRPLAEQTEQMQRLQEFLSRLEEERLKIEAFKRELPLCMQLLNNVFAPYEAMETYRRQLQTYQTSHGPRLLLEEFIPLKDMSIEESEKPAQTEKANWMVSAQLWSAPAAPDAAERPIPQLKESAENCFALTSKPRCGGAFHPFSKDKNKDSTAAPPPPPAPSPPPPPPSCSLATGALLPELALASVDGGMEEKIENGLLRGGRSCKVGGDQPQSSKAGGGNCNVPGEAAPSTQRKARRCWSPDLHRRFVNALQILGGSQVATPKQIRELMKVDGLTNDEVKSHLQKYRLHTRRPMPAAASATGGPQLVVLGGIWVPPEYATSAAVGAGPAMYGAHHSAAHFCPPPPLPQDYYQNPPPPPAPSLTVAAAAKLHGHLHPLYRGASAARYKGHQGSSDSEPRERSESIEEERGREPGAEEEEEELEEDLDEMEAEKAIGVAKPEDGAVLLKF